MKRTNQDCAAFSPRLIAAIEKVNQKRSAYQAASDRCFRLGTLCPSWNTMMDAHDERERAKLAYLDAIDEKLKIQIEESQRQ